MQVVSVGDLISQFMAAEVLTVHYGRSVLPVRIFQIR